MSEGHLDIAAWPGPEPEEMVWSEGFCSGVAWVTRVNDKPPLIAVALGKTHHTNPGIHAAKAFSVNIPGVDLMEKTDCCGIVSGRKVDKAGPDWPVYERAHRALIAERDMPGIWAEEAGGYLRPCLMRAERTAEQCHRRLLGEELAGDDATRLRHM